MQSHSSQSFHRSNEQLRLYHAYVKQLKSLDEVKIQIEDKVWRGRLREVKNARYLLKALDYELPITNPDFPNKSPNKNKFSGAMKEHLTHHISWLREAIWDNGLIPWNDRGLDETIAQ